MMGCSNSAGCGLSWPPLAASCNPVARTAHQGGAVGGDDVRRVIHAGLVQMAAVKGLYDRLVTTAVKRAVGPLYQEAGLTRRGPAGPRESPTPNKSA